jgi:hypothetical protein
MLQNQKYICWDLIEKGIVLDLYAIPQSFVSLTIFDIVLYVLYII